MAGITVIGLIFIDIKGFPYGKYDYRTRNLGEVKIMHGGVCRNVAYNMAAEGAKVNFVALNDGSAIGTDAVKRLEEIGVDTRYVRMAPDGIGKWLVALNEDGDAAGQISHMPDLAPLEKIIDECGDEIVKNSDSIVTEFDLGMGISRKVLDLAKKYNKPVYTVMGNMSVISENPEIVKEVKCFVCNEAEIAKLTDRNLFGFNPQLMLDFLVEQSERFKLPPMIITMGAQGSVYYDREKRERGCCPAIQTKIVDTSGAGDAFLSGVILALESGKSLKEAAELGTKMATGVISSAESSYSQIDAK